MRSRLLSPRLRTAITDHWDSLCTIQLVLTSASASNQKVPIGVQNVPGMVDIPCRLAPTFPQGSATPDYEERRSNSVVTTFQQAVVKLNGYFPDIQIRIHRATIDGVTWLIRSVDHDGQHFSTRLRVEQVTA